MVALKSLQNSGTLFLSVSYSSFKGNVWVYGLLLTSSMYSRYMRMLFLRFRPTKERARPTYIICRLELMPPPFLVAFVKGNVSHNRPRKITDDTSWLTACSTSQFSRLHFSDILLDTSMMSVRKNVGAK